MAPQRPGAASSAAALRCDIFDLAKHLRQERLYVQHEKAQLQDLNEKVKATAEQLSHTAWMAHRQRENLANLICGPAGADNSPALACLRANLLERTVFEDAYKRLGHHEAVYAEFLAAIRSKPRLLAACLAQGDRADPSDTASVVSTIFGGLYGSCMLPEDERLVLRLLHNLMRSQLGAASNPRKLLRQGNCAFSRLYKSFSEELFSAKVFLTSALHEPILSLLSDDEVFLDIDPAKTPIRFTPSERMKRFGAEGTSGYEEKLERHRKSICDRLGALASGFVDGIRDNLHCFPTSLARLLRAMYSTLAAGGRVNPREVNAVCVDVLFGLFICPAIVDPNPVGIIDTPISYVARSNLMQVAQILQALAMWKWEEIDPRLMDLYGRFDKDAVPSMLESVLESADSMAGASQTDEDFFEANDAASLEASNGNVGGSPLGRLAVLLTLDELEELVAFFRSVSGQQQLSGSDSAELASLLESLPEADKKPLAPAARPSTTPTKCGEGASTSTPTLSLSLSSTMNAKRQQLSSRLSAAVKRSSSSTTATTPSTPGSDENGPGGENDDSSNSAGLDEAAAAIFQQQCEPETVLVIPLPDRGGISEPPGFLSEDHVVTRSRQSARVVRMNLENLPDSGQEDVEASAASVADDGRRRNSHGNSEENSSLVSVGAAGEKRTRFSLSHDDGSIGNASDNLEAISEAASNHSVASSLEDEPVDPADPIIDNLSDMVSANVSGRGTPNVSGRDTPSGQVTEDGAPDDAANNNNSSNSNSNNNNNNSNNNNNQPSNSRQQRNDSDSAANSDQNRPPGAAADATGRGGRAAGVGVRDGNEAASGGHGARRRNVTDERGRKSGEPDLEEKFGRFEIKGDAGHGSSSRGNVSVSEQGDETVSMVSDTWSTDVLASDTETTTVGGATARPRVRLEDQLSAPSSSANLLDVAETASEAWSMDVLASDTESLRLAELIDDDGASMAGRSDDTRFTDDTTRSDPEPLLMEAGASKDAASARRPLHARATEEMRPSRAAAVEQWARQSSGQHAPKPVLSGQRRSIDSAGLRPPIIEGSILKKPALATPPDSIAARDASSGSAARLVSHPSAVSIASSTESSVGDSASANGKAKAPLATTDADAPKKPSGSTGAIPKSISFDKAAPVATKDDPSRSPVSDTTAKPFRADKSFFRSWKLPKIGRPRGGGSSFSGPSKRSQQAASAITADPDEQSTTFYCGEEEPVTGDDILAKYRTKTAADAGNDVVGLSTSDRVILSDDVADGEEFDEDGGGVSASHAFEDTKRKVRLMLAEADLTALADRKSGADNELVAVLRVQLAEAVNLQNRGLVAQLRETLRCLSVFDNDACHRIVLGLRDDYRRRSAYLSYLVRCRQGLLTTLASQRRLLARVETDRSVGSAHHVNVCIRLFLERREAQMGSFVASFRESCGAADEKVTLMEEFLAVVWSQVEADPGLALLPAPLCRAAVERAIVSHIYVTAMYPNGDGDLSRDVVLSDHMDRLSAAGLSPGHRDLRIGRHFRHECPWPSAQAELRQLPAVKTAEDKVACVVRCSQTIMNLLSLGAAKEGSSVPAADDFLPVLVFVVIKANPPNLLSTIQYVDSFYGSRLTGEDQYWWMQFVAAVEFTKTMDYA